MAEKTVPPAHRDHPAPQCPPPAPKRASRCGCGPYRPACLQVRQLDDNQCAIMDFPDHATFREKGAKLACADKLGVFLSDVTLCDKARFDPPTTRQI